MANRKHLATSLKHPLVEIFKIETRHPRGYLSLVVNKTHICNFTHKVTLGKALLEGESLYGDVKRNIENGQPNLGVRMLIACAVTNGPGDVVEGEVKHDH